METPVDHGRRQNPGSETESWKVLTFFDGRLQSGTLPLRRNTLSTSVDMTASSFTFHDISSQFPSLTVLVVGDFMIDRFIRGRVDRISPEAPIPVLSAEHDDPMLGGGGNVVANIASLGGRAIPVSVIGADAVAQRMRTMLDDLGVDHHGLISSPRRLTTRKSRFVAGQQQLLRFDEENVAPLAADDRAALRAAFDAALAPADVVVLSDYGKGVLADGVAAELVAAARAAGRPVLVDPKGTDFGIYRGATTVTPNRRELAEATGLPTATDAQVEAAARRLIAAHGFEFVLATRSEAGMSVVDAHHTLHLPTRAREVFDVSGAGDTVIAAFALAYATGCGPAAAADLANLAAGVVVSKFGTAQATIAELTVAEIHRHHHHHRSSAGRGPLDRAAAAGLAADWRAAGLRVGFTNGCFDVLHVGHLAQLEDARTHCDRLIVGLNTDASVRRNKGAERPINRETDRARLLAALSVVDAVVLFDEDTPFELIAAIRPDLLVKGADYTIDEVVGADLVISGGGRVHLSPLIAGRSTSETLKRIERLG
jgi:D-beta-D-heptose 7-phosphate kinase/D-beta-D-heptose 1-phosphate adenosyltransferase